MALNHPRPCGLGAGGNSAIFQGSSPERASGDVLELDCFVDTGERGYKEGLLFVNTLKSQRNEDHYPRNGFRFEWFHLY